MIYLDNNATTRLLPEVKSCLFSALNTDFGNPSSSHSYGVEAQNTLWGSREEIAKVLNCQPEQLVFTSGGSESNTQIIQSVLKREKGTLLFTAVDHSSIIANFEALEEQGWEVITITCDEYGLICLDELRGQLEQYNPVFVSIGWVNSETGVIQPIEKIAEVVKASGALFHTDAAQFIGRGVVDLSKLDIDFLSFTGHKFHSLKGVGAIYSKDLDSLRSLIQGGSQENSLRAGTENLLGIISMAEALKLRYGALQEDLIYLEELRNRFEELLLKNVSGVKINGDVTSRVVNTSNVRFEGVDGRALVAQLDANVVIASQTSACTSMIPEPSKVLRTMGLTVEEAFSSLRFSFAVDNSMAEVETAVEIIENCVDRVRAFGL